MHWSRWWWATASGRFSWRLQPKSPSSENSSPAAWRRRQIKRLLCDPARCDVPALPLLLLQRRRFFFALAEHAEGLAGRGDGHGLAVIDNGQRLAARGDQRRIFRIRFLGRLARQRAAGMECATRRRIAGRRDFSLEDDA